MGLALLHIMGLLSTIVSAAGFQNDRAWTTAEIPSLAGKVALVTGANTGIGYVSAVELSRAGARVYLACRSQERAEEAIARLKLEVPQADVHFLPFDLTSLASARGAAKVVLEREERLDIVLANAAVMATPYKLVGGLEQQFVRRPPLNPTVAQWNHLGHYALIEPLLPLLIKTSKTSESSVRIVNVASLGHKFCPVPDFSGLDGVNRPLSTTWARYGQSKLANIYYTVALQKRLDKENISCLSLHPGNIDTELTRGPVDSFGFLGSMMKFASGYLATRPADGAKTQLYCATSPEIDSLKLRGSYFVPTATVALPSPQAQNKDLAEQLWTLSERLLVELA